jgi:hypothetical protein
MYDAVCHNGGLMGSTTVLVEGARLGIDEAEIPKIKKKVCVLSIPFEAPNPGACEHFRTLDKHRTCNPCAPRNMRPSKTLRNGTWMCQS